MAMPTFTAEASVYRTKRGYRNLSFATLNLADAIMPQASTRIRLLSTISNQFTCGSSGCICTGDSDCNDMYNTDVCGSNGVCWTSGSQVNCWCPR